MESQKNFMIPFGAKTKHVIEVRLRLYFQYSIVLSDEIELGHFKKDRCNKTKISNNTVK